MQAPQEIAGFLFYSLWTGHAEIQQVVIRNATILIYQIKFIDAITT